MNEPICIDSNILTTLLVGSTVLDVPSLEQHIHSDQEDNFSADVLLPGENLSGENLPGENLVNEHRDEQNVEEEVRVTNFVCSETKRCRRKFKTKGGLDRHVSSYHKGPTKYNCRRCGKQFYLKKHLDSHEKGHAHIEVTCEKCGKISKNWYRLQQHMGQYHTVVNPVCSLCFKVFETRKEQRLHNKTCGKQNNRKKLLAARKEVLSSPTVLAD